MNLTAHRNDLICPSLLQSTEYRLCHALDTAQGAPQLRGWTPPGSFPLFGRGDAAVQLLAVGVVGPLLGFVTRVGAVPVTKTLGLPVPCREETEGGYGENRGYVGGQSPGSCLLAGSSMVP